MQVKIRCANERHLETSLSISIISMFLSLKVAEFCSKLNTLRLRRKVLHIRFYSYINNIISVIDN